ncbi:uncharacterized protein LOC120268506 [Dioscorea cayenensis subsp. rotundata]|uniref:Uncharacterized protein LOC120268506 n=1 Tax=Dioscorea cayennensis subsp. rotundata TaxID=55577 RepID=A0AB40BYP1_DIOCR|nr:uncharacterized protein LOC120268506 [Dioscorea cayenensis subsp. rotundata]
MRFDKSQHANIVTHIEKGVISTGIGCNQDTSLARPKDTHWESHYYAILHLLMMWPGIMDVVGNVHDDGTNPDQQGAALRLIDHLERFEFAFILFLMKKVLGIKFKLQSLRDDGWDELLANGSKFCVEIDIEMPNNMEGRFLVSGHARFLDMIMQDMNSHFSESTIELPSCISFLDPKQSLSRFDSIKLVRIAKLYP